MKDMDAKGMDYTADFFIRMW
jgi:glycerol-3-phosphate acyltransferase PlsY